MLTAQDMSYDEARNLHSKWQKHQAFMAELASNKDWLDKIDKVSRFKNQLCASALTQNQGFARWLRHISREAVQWFWLPSFFLFLLKEGQALVAEKPELKPVVQQILEDLQHQWEEVEGTTRTKAQCLFDANRAELFTQSCSALGSWLNNIESQLHSDDYGKDLTSVNILLKKQQVKWWLFLMMAAGSTLFLATIDVCRIR